METGIDGDDSRKGRWSSLWTWLCACMGALHREEAEKVLEQEQVTEIMAAING